MPDKGKKKATDGNPDKGHVTTKGMLRLLSWLIFVALSATTAALLLYFDHFGHQPLSSDQAVWGQFGDFIGGSLNPLFAFLSFIALVFTLVLQTRQLSLSRQELELTRAELAKSAEAQAELARLTRQQVDWAAQTTMAQQETADAQLKAALAMQQQATAAVLAAQAQAVHAELSRLTQDLGRSGALGSMPYAEHGPAKERVAALQSQLQAVADRLIVLDAGAGHEPPPDASGTAV